MQQQEDVYDDDHSTLLSNIYQHRRASLGCKTLDQLFHGGFWGLTEISGEAGCGKTQIVLKMLLASIQSNNDYTIYIFSEGRAPTSRLRQILQYDTSKSKSYHCCCYKNQFDETDKENKNENEILQRVLVREISDIDDLMYVLRTLLPREFEFRKRHGQNIRLVVIDSLAGVIRSSFKNTKKELRERSQYFVEISTLMKLWNHQYNCPFVVINQVTSWDNVMRPSLGHVWSTCINARIMLNKKISISVSGDEKCSKTLRTEFCPDVAEFCVPYSIGSCGVCACTDIV